MSVEIQQVALRPGLNLSDVDDPATARINLGLGPSGGPLEVANFSALPVAASASGEQRTVLAAEGSFLLGRKRAGNYHSDGATWTRLGDALNLFNDANFTLYNGTDTSKKVKVDLSGLSTSTTETWLNQAVARTSGPTFNNIILTNTGTVLDIDSGKNINLFPTANTINVGQAGQLLKALGNFQVIGNTTLATLDAVSMDDTLTVTIASGVNSECAIFAQNDTVNNPDTAHFSNTGTGWSINVLSGNSNFGGEVNLGSGKKLFINLVEVLSATTLGSSVVNSSLTSVGTLTALTVGGVSFLNATRSYLGESDTFRVSNHGNPKIKFQLESASSANNNPTEVSLITNNSGATFQPSVLNFARSRSSSIGGVTALGDNDPIGQITFTGADGVDLNRQAATIEIQASGTFSPTSTPGKMLFKTTPSATTVPVIRMTIAADGGVTLASPTGGSKGAGTLNAVGVYDDDTLLTDYIFEMKYLGHTIDKKNRAFKMKSIIDEIEFTRKNLHLSTIVGRKEWEKRGKPSVGRLTTQIWETVETHFLYLADHHQEIAKLNKKILDLEIRLNKCQ